MAGLQAPSLSLSLSLSLPMPPHGPTEARLVFSLCTLWGSAPGGLGVRSVAKFLKMPSDSFLGVLVGWESYEGPLGTLKRCYLLHVISRSQ